MTLTPDEIERVARKYLHPDQLVILVVGDRQLPDPSALLHKGAPYRVGPLLYAWACGRSSG
jgi:hypothetical protein